VVYLNGLRTRVEEWRKLAWLLTEEEKAPEVGWDFITSSESSRGGS
jgi:hypothetical protein